MTYVISRIQGVDDMGQLGGDFVVAEDVGGNVLVKPKSTWI